MALTTARNTPQQGVSSYIDSIYVPCAASQTFYTGALVATNASGYLVPGSTATTLTATGVIGAQPGKVLAPSYTSTSNAGETKLQVMVGTFKFNNSGSDPVVQADLNKVCYIEDDETVAHTGTGKSIAGRVVGIDDSTSTTGAGVWVAIGVTPLGLVGSAGPTGATGPTGPTGP
jgi:hypothetical protein